MKLNNKIPAGVAESLVTQVEIALKMMKKGEITDAIDTLSLALDNVRLSDGEQSELRGFVDAATAEYAEEGRIEVDGGAVVSVGDGGAYVEAWVWVESEESGDE